MQIYKYIQTYKYSFNTYLRLLLPATTTASASDKDNCANKIAHLMSADVRCHIKSQCNSPHTCIYTHGIHRYGHMYYMHGFALTVVLGVTCLSLRAYVACCTLVAVCYKLVFVSVVVGLSIAVRMLLLQLLNSHNCFDYFTLAVCLAFFRC